MSGLFSRYSSVGFIFLFAKTKHSFYRNTVVFHTKNYFVLSLVASWYKREGSRSGSTPNSAGVQRRTE